MRKILFFILLLVTLSYLSLSAITAVGSAYVPATVGTLAPINQAFQCETDLKWLHAGTVSADTKIVYHAISSTDTLTTYSKTIVGQLSPDVQIKAHSKTMECIVLQDSATTVSVYKFSVDNPTALTVLTSGSPILLTAGNIATTTFKVGKDCTGLLLKTGSTFFSYHWNVGGTVYEADTLPTTIWANPQFNEEHTIAVGDGGIYTYATGTKIWTKTANPQTFNTNKKVYSSTGKLVVLSWQDGTPSTDKDYKLHVYSHAAGVFTLIYSTTGTSFGAVPSLTISSTYNTFILYHQSTAAAHPLTTIAKVVDYTASTAANLVLPTFITGVNLIVIEVSDRFVYARTKVVSSEQIAAWAIWGTNTVAYTTPFADTDTTYTRNLIRDQAQNRLQVYYQKSAAANEYTVQKEIYSSINNIFDWNTLNGGATIANVNIDLRQAARVNNWWLESTVSSNKVFSSVSINPSATTPVILSIGTLATTYVTKSVSPSQSCAILADGIAALQVWKFESTSPSVTLKDITSLVTPANINTIVYGVSDSCTGLRLDNKVYHWSATDFFEDTPIPALAWVNPAFPADYSYMVADAGIYRYFPKVGGTAGFYVLQRNDTFYTNKEVIKSGLNHIIFSYQANGSIFNWKIQFNVLNASSQPKVLINFGEFNGTSFTVPKLYVSPSLNRIIIYANLNSATTWLYYGKSIDFTNKIIKDITFPTVITSVENTITLGDDFVYFKNVAAVSGIKKHYGYSIQSALLFPIFQQNYVEYLTDGYKRTIIIPDPVTKKLVLGYQFNKNSHIIIEKEIKKSVQDILAADKPPMFELNQGELTTTLALPATLFTRATTAPGKYSWLNLIQQLQYVQYNPSVPTTKKRTILSTALTAGIAKVKSSPNQDCVMTYKSTAELNIHYINTTASSISVIQNMQVTALADLVSDAAIAAALPAAVLTNGCQKFKLGRYVYFKNLTATPKYTKAITPAGTDWSAAVYTQDLKFAYFGTSIYQFVNNDYVPIVTGVTLSPNVKLVSNNDANKLLVLHYTSSAPLTYQVRLFGVFNNAWFQSPSKVANGTFETLSPFAPTMIVSPDFQTVGVGYMDGASPAPSGIIKKIVYSIPPVITQYSGPLQIVSLTTMPLFIFTNNFFYFRTNQAGSNNKQIIYQIDKANTKIFQLSRMTGLTDATLIAIKQTFLEQINGKLTIYYDTQSTVSLDTFTTLTKRQLGSVDLQIAAKLNDGGYTVVNNYIYPCPTGCILCQNNNRICQICGDGYVLDPSTGLCIPCINSCKTCNLATPHQCTSCLSGYNPTLNVNNCDKCHDSCLTCSGTTSAHCTSCKVGYFTATSPGSCQSCKSYCDVCTTKLDCTTCRPGYVHDLISSTCVQCISGCKTCKTDKIFQCVSCGTGFYPVLNGSAIVACKSCTQFCTTCASGVCSACRDGYVLTSSNTCVQKCKPPCLTCADGTSTVCTSCFGGFALIGTKCSPNVTCSTTSSCTGCPIGYILLSGQCYQCNAGPNCQSCSNTNAEVCIGCLRGYYLTNSQKCGSCVSGCAKCNNANDCNQCLKGYTLAGSSAPSTCLKCDVSCQTCFGSIYACQTCAPGYTKNGWTCLSNSFIAWVVKLNVDFSMISTTNFNDLKNYVCQATSRSSQDYVVTSVTTGSTVVAGSLSVGTSNVAAQTAIVNTLAAAFTQGTPIGGVAVVGSSFTAVTADGQIIQGQDNASYYRNVAIIVGIVIPAALIIIFIVIMLVCMKKGAFSGAMAANAKIGDVSMDKFQRKQERKDSQMHSIRRE